MPPLADLNLSEYFTEPFWLRFIAHGAFFVGCVYFAARIHNDGLSKSPAWRFWIVAAAFLGLWNLTSLASILLRESVDVGIVSREGDRFFPLSRKGEVYYYLQFDVVFLVLAAVFALCALHEGRKVTEVEGEEEPDA